MRHISFVLILLTFASLAIAQDRPASPAVVNPVLLHPARQILSLDGQWEFATDPKKVGESERWFDPQHPLDSKITVPGCWEEYGVGGPGNSTAVAIESSVRPLKGCYVGAAWYRKRVAIPAFWRGKQIWLAVGGVNAAGRFWVNGRYVSKIQNYCGTEKFNITDLVRPGESATIAAEVRNDLPSRKGLFNWIERFGGLYRSVELQASGETLIDHAHIEPRLDERCAIAHVTISHLNQPNDCAVQAFLTPGESRTRRAVEKGSNDVEIRVPIEDVHPWSPENPFLYTAEISLLQNEKVIDGQAFRFGLRKLEVKDNNLYLNNSRYFLRAFGDDFIYPQTLASPASRDVHLAHLKLAKSYGFNYVRHHTHCELQEFFDAADQVGIMVQPELPYYGPKSSTNLPEMFDPQRDLKELVANYRNHVSLTTYCFGNEGHMGSPLDERMYALAKQLDPTRLVIHQDGGKNTPANSDFGKGLNVHHEYLNLATEEDPRLEKLYNGAIRPPRTMADFLSEARSQNIPQPLAESVLDAGQELQRIFQKSGIEKARLEPACDGYVYWTIADVGSPAAQGLLDQFWRPKKSAAEEFIRFNGPTALLHKQTAESPILTAGDTIKVEWLVSHFAAAPLDAAVHCRLEADGKLLFDRVHPPHEIAAGQLASLDTDIIAIPETIDHPLRARLVGRIEKTGIINTWPLWIFPRAQTESPSTDILITHTLDAEARAALDRGGRVLYLGLGEFYPIKPGADLGWWSLSNQRGTAIVNHPAFGAFPHDGYLSPLLFRLVSTAAPRSDPRLKNVEPLMLGHTSGGYVLYVFQARCGKGKLLACGLDVLADHPEAKALLHEILAYMRSDQFAPKGELDLAQ